MTEKTTLTKISFITDDDTDMYHIGEVDGIFSEAQLHDYLDRFGEKGCCIVH